MEHQQEKPKKALQGSRLTSLKPLLYRHAEHPAFQIQRTLGNRAMLPLLRSGIAQAKLTVGSPDDIYEQEADRMADEVLRMPEPSVQTRPG